jgi:prepilin-type N-terminal cleavage/methylation domain-containing protein
LCLTNKSVKLKLMSHRMEICKLNRMEKSKQVFCKEKNIMKSRKGFTLIELMVVVLIVAVLAAVLVPLMTARLEAARWSEGKAGCGSLATAIRAMYAEVGEEGWGDIADTTDPETYMTQSDLRGKYFSYVDYTITASLDPLDTEYPVHYSITVAQPANPSTQGASATWTKTGYTLDYMGTWTEN